MLGGCSQQFTVSVNDAAVFDPTGRLISSQVTDPDLQGCINFAVNQQRISDASELQVLSCPNSNVLLLNNIGLFSNLRFLDLTNNSISNITPLEELKQLGGLNLGGNVIRDITALLNIPGLTSVDLTGNNEIPCDQLAALKEKLGANLLAPAECRN